MKLPCKHVLSILCLSITLVCGAIKPRIIFGQNTGLLEQGVATLISAPQTRNVGPTATTRSLYLSLSLPLRNEAQLDAFLKAVNDPTSPSFHHYLTVAQFTQLYGPTQTDYNLLVAWAKSEGLTVTLKPANRGFVGVLGSVGLINKVFNVTITDFVDGSTGRTFFAPNAEPTPATPVALLAISGLDNAMPFIPHFKTAPIVKRQSPPSPSSGTGSGPSSVVSPARLYHG
ncbi:MAG: protease pro-enzyme activation domain-containing protein [Acidobacteriaceae bacterium]